MLKSRIRKASLPKNPAPPDHRAKVIRPDPVVATGPTPAKPYSQQKAISMSGVNPGGKIPLPQ